ncbi:MAG: phytoene desaturase [Bacteroidetes bacterium]|nr:phytoene desaturase [Bacteroidota bacterium]
MQKKAVVIGSGFSGLSTAAFMAKAGWEVHVLEKHDQPGGRARRLKVNGFIFDMGPSWYWMPDVFERFFAQFGKSPSDYYELQRLNPSYRVYWEEGGVDIPANLDELKKLFEEFEQGSSKKLDRFLEEAAYKYETGIKNLVFKPGRSMLEFMDWDLMKGLIRLDVFTSIKKHVSKYFKHPKIRQLLEFPVLFLGALPEDTPALYSLMNYADIMGGTWYPQGGMFQIAEAMHQLAESLGVQFHFNENVNKIEIQNGLATKLFTDANEFDADVVIGSADYHFIETQLLPEGFQSYSDAYWEKRRMAPSCLIFYIGLNKKLNDISHHSLFFDAPFEKHAKEIYIEKQWPEEPLFYVSATSVTDSSVAPPGCENLFILIPLAAGLEQDDEAHHEKCFSAVINRLEKHLGQSISDSIIYKQSFSQSDFISAYNSFKGNAYGLANTLLQTAVFKPACRSKKVKNLFYTGQLTVPGPGVPPSIISGEVVAKQVIKYYHSC